MTSLVVGFIAGFVLGIMVMDAIGVGHYREQAAHYFDRMMVYQKALMKIRKDTDDFHVFNEIENVLHHADKTETIK